MALALGAVVTGRGTPRSITVDNGTEFASKVMDLWAYRNSVHLDFIRPERPVENWYIESFNGRLRDECLNVEVFFTLADARRKLALWHHDYNYHRPHSAERETPRQPLQGEGFMTLPPVLRTRSSTVRSPRQFAPFERAEGIRRCATMSAMGCISS